MVVKVSFYIDKQNINKYDKDVNVDKYIVSINNIFAILFNHDKNKYPILYKSMLSIFNVEANTSKYQSFVDTKPDNIDLDKILTCTLLKGRETINCVWQIHDIYTDFKNSREPANSRNSR